MNYQGVTSCGFTIYRLEGVSAMMYRFKPWIQRMARGLIQAGFKIHVLDRNVAFFLAEGKTLWFAEEGKERKSTIDASFLKIQNNLQMLSEEQILSLCEVYNEALDPLAVDQDLFYRPWRLT
jgi:hypothetical protein